MWSERLDPKSPFFRRWMLLCNDVCSCWSAFDLESSAAILIRGRRIAANSVYKAMDCLTCKHDSEAYSPCL
jgi:hypothetical protein